MQFPILCDLVFHFIFFVIRVNICMYIDIYFYPLTHFKYNYVRKKQFHSLSLSLSLQITLLALLTAENFAQQPIVVHLTVSANHLSWSTFCSSKSISIFNVSITARLLSSPKPTVFPVYRGKASSRMQLIDYEIQTQYIFKPHNFIWIHVCMCVDICMHFCAHSVDCYAYNPRLVSNVHWWRRLVASLKLLCHSCFRFYLTLVAVNIVVAVVFAIFMGFCCGAALVVSLNFNGTHKWSLCDRQTVP